MSNGKVEEMLTQIIKIVGSMQSDFQEMKGDISGLKSEVQEMKVDISGLKSEVQEMKVDISGLKSEVQEMKGDIKGLKSELQDLKFDIQEERLKNEERHKEVLSHFKALENDQDFIWEKAVRNEREIAHIKRQLSN
jgi:chromosome segregation ATPase